MLKDNIATPQSGAQLEVLQEGIANTWSGASAFDMMLYKSLHTIFAPIAGTTEGFMASTQMGLIPYISAIATGAPAQLEIAKGTKNPVALNFMPGALNLADRYTWDKDRGRIEIDLAKFFVRNNSTGDWIEKDIQAINVLATTSYLIAYLTEEDVVNDTPLLIKTTGFSLTYEGSIKAKVYGIIVEE